MPWRVVGAMADAVAAGLGCLVTGRVVSAVADAVAGCAVTGRIVRPVAAAVAATMAAAHAAGAATARTRACRRA